MSLSPKTPVCLDCMRMMANTMFGWFCMCGNNSSTPKWVPLGELPSADQYKVRQTPWTADDEVTILNLVIVRGVHDS